MTNEIILTGKDLENKISELVKIQTDSSGWSTYYVDNGKNKWVKEYPNSEQHGGGLPQLRQLIKFPWEK